MADDRFYRRLAAQRDQQIAKRERTRQPEVATQRLGRITQKRLFKAAHGAGGVPVGNSATCAITIPSMTWARLIVRAACAFDEVPGFTVLKKHPLPDAEHGIRAGERVFAIANRKRDVDAVAAEIDRARAALGQYPSEPPRGHRSDYDYGIWAYFRQLDRFFDGVRWSPPRSSRPASPPTGGRRAKGVPSPTLAALKRALRALESMRRSDELDVRKIISLYGLRGIGSKALVDSSKYVQRHGQAKKAWQLPRRRAPAGNASRAKPEPFKAHLSWTVKDVRAAIEGWIKRLDA